MNIEVMRNTLHQSEAGQLTFPMVLGALSAVGVESYFADLARRTDTFYLPNGETHVEAMNHPSTKIAEDFSKPEIVAAIRAAQADQAVLLEKAEAALANDPQYVDWCAMRGRWAEAGAGIAGTAAIGATGRGARRFRLTDLVRRGRDDTLTRGFTRRACLTPSAAAGTGGAGAAEATAGVGGTGGGAVWANS